MLYHCFSRSRVISTFLQLPRSSSASRLRRAVTTSGRWGSLGLIAASDLAPLKKRMTTEDVYRHAALTLEQCILHGTTRMRSWGRMGRAQGAHCSVDL